MNFLSMISIRPYNKNQNNNNNKNKNALEDEDLHTLLEYRSKVHLSLAYLLKKYFKRYDEAREQYQGSIKTGYITYMRLHTYLCILHGIIFNCMVIIEVYCMHFCHCEYSRYRMQFGCNISRILFEWQFFVIFSVV